MDNIMNSVIDLKIEPEYQESYDNWVLDKSPQNTTGLLKKLNPVVNKALTSYGGGIGQNPTMKAKAKIMAAKALDTYDPSRASLKTHILSQLRGLQRVAATEKNIIKLPEQIAYDYKKLEDAETELEEDLGRLPNVQELADYTSFSPKRIEHIRKSQRPINTGTIMQAKEESYMPAASIPGQDRASDAWFEYVYEELSDYDKALADQLLGLHGKKKTTMLEAAKKLGVSPSALSQRVKKIQDKLNLRERASIL